MRTSLLCFSVLTLSACTGVKEIDETWACTTGNIPSGKHCAPIPTASAEDDNEWHTPKKSSSGIKKNPATIQKLPEKSEPTEMYPKAKTPPKTWGK
ncbi:MAG: hypothetical protein ACRBDI_05460 [Alphaproteobacteria bacterium]